MSYDGETTSGLVLLLLPNAYTEMGPKSIIKTEAEAISFHSWWTLIILGIQWLHIPTTEVF